MNYCLVLLLSNIWDCQVILNGIEYKPNVASSTKKQAKADAATLCLQQLGLLAS